MTTKDIIIAFLIHLVIPLIGLLYFLKISIQMKKEKIVAVPLISLFIIFATYGSLLLIMLISVFWRWSGMASLGMLYLILGAPILMGLIAFRYQKKKGISKYHNWTFISSACYFVIAPITFLLAILRDL
jgi:hypothetical protein